MVGEDEFVTDAMTEGSDGIIGDAATGSLVMENGGSIIGDDRLEEVIEVE